MSEEQHNTRNAAKEQQQQQKQQQAKQLTEEEQLVADAVDEAIRMEAAAAQASSSSAQSSNKGKGPAKIPLAAATSTPNGTDPSLPSLGSDSEFVTITSSQEGSRISHALLGLVCLGRMASPCCSPLPCRVTAAHVAAYSRDPSPLCVGPPSGSCYHSV